MMEKILTIIIPSYNMEAYLERCLSSLLVEEDLMDLFEALVINDGSKDKTSEIGHRFEAAYPNTFRVIDKENGHYGSCVNRGLAEAKGTFVKILDADDSFDNDVFKEYLLFLEKEAVINSADVIVSDYAEVDNDLKVKKVTCYSSHPTPYSFAEVTDADRFEWFIHCLTYRTDILKNNHYQQTEGIAYTDQEWAFIPMAFAEVLIKYDKILYLYTVGREAQSVNPRVHAKNLWMEVAVVKRLVRFYSSHKNQLKELNRRFLFDRLQTIVTHLYQLYLLTFKKYIHQMEPLEELDGMLKSDCPEIYEATNLYVTRIARFSFHPIKNWRAKSSLLIFLQEAIYNAADWVAKISERIR